MKENVTMQGIAMMQGLIEDLALMSCMIHIKTICIISEMGRSVCYSYTFDTCMIDHFNGRD